MSPLNSPSRPSFIAAFGMVVAFVILAFCIAMPGQEVPLQKEASAPKPAPALNQVLRQNIADWMVQRRAILDDWSHRHVLFSNPGTEEEAFANGTHDHWLNTVNDPRYILQQMKRDLAARRFIAEGMGLGSEQNAAQQRVGAQEAPQATQTIGSARAAKAPKKSKLQRDWSMTMGSGATVGAGQYPAKYSFNPNSTPNCATDYAAFNTGVAGGTSQPTIIAYNNLYKGASPGCGTTGVPTIYWQYNTAYPQGSTTGDGSKIVTSVVLSLDGSRLAFIESNSSNVASLVILKWAASSSLVQMNAAGNNVLPADYSSCSAPCMTRITFANSHNDINSSPFYDYVHDVLYVGDSSGMLHKFQNIFVSGTPGEITTGGWPVTVSSKTLTSPVYDSSTTNVFVADAGGFLYSYAASNGARVGVSSQLAATGSKGIVDGPLVDPVAGTVYVFVGDDGNTATNHNCNNATGCDGVFRFSTTAFTTSGTGLCSSSNGTSWTAGTNCGVESVFGVGTSSTILYDGAFDNAYYTSNGSSGNLWTCAATGTPAPKLVNSSMTSFGSTLSIAHNAINPLASGAATCSPVAEIYNGTTDRIFASVTASGNQTSVCPSGPCIYSFNVTSSVPSSASNGLAVSGGSSGVIIDNISAQTGASQVYFSTLGSQACAGNNGTGSTGQGTGGCAVQASQSALQ